MDVPRGMDTGDNLFYVLGQQVKIVSFVCDKCVGYQFTLWHNLSRFSPTCEDVLSEREKN